jgi:FkbM family methyltransferase
MISLREGLNYLRYEAHLISLAGKTFGWVKAMRLAAGFPFVLSTRANRKAYEFMGRCEMTLRGRRLVFAHPDIRFIDEIILRNCYTSSDGFQIQSDWTIVDCGANIGIFTLFAAIQATEGRVLAIEPAEYNCELLTENVAANGFKNVRVLKLAVSDSSGTGTLLLTHPGNEYILKGGMDNSNAKTEKVKTVTMSELFDLLELSHVDLLKMDVEGMEFEVFKDSAWLERVKRIVLEVHLSVGKPGWISQRMKEAGFQALQRPAYDEDCVYMFGSRNNPS